MKIKLILSLLLIFYTSITMAQIEFPVYKPLPPVQRVPPPPIQTWEPQKRERISEQPVQQLETNVIAKFVIQKATVNGKDYSEHYVTNEACLVVYTEKDSKEIFFANYLPLSKSISTGTMINPELSSKAATSTSYKTQTSKFKWSFSNSYDNIKGIADVHLLKIYTNEGTSFSCTISSKDTFLKFTGQMENPNDN